MGKHAGAVAALSVFLTLSAHADTLSSITFGQFLQSDMQGFGQSFTTAPGGSYDDITFSFYTMTHYLTPPIPFYNEVDPNYPETPYAIGTGYLFSQPYTGVVSALSSSAPGFLGMAVASGNVYTFAPSLTLSGNTKYYFYENTPTPANTFIFMGGQVAGNEFDGPFASSTFELNAFSSNYLVTGVPVTMIPEPPTVLLLGTALLALAGLWRTRLRSTRWVG